MKTVPVLSPPRVQLKSTYCRWVDSFALTVVGASVVENAAACVAIGATAAGACEMATVPANIVAGAATGGCVLVGMLTSGGCYAAVAAGTGFTAWMMAKALGCSPGNHLEAGEHCSRLRSYDSECRPGVCSNAHTFGDQYCCPGKRPGDQAATLKMAGVRYCRYQCVGADGEKSICLPTEDGREWINLIEDERRATGDWCLTNSDCLSDQCSWIHGCQGQNVRCLF
jgi:hypothetical protein